MNDPRTDWLVAALGLAVLIACAVVVLAVMPGALR
jgi:hypothetical protein